MGRHATREEEVDRLLRGDVFVDLFRAVRQGLRASVESYSIKKLEPLYGLDPRSGAARRRLEHRRVRAVAGRVGVRFRALPDRPEPIRPSPGSKATTATTASRTGACATGWRSGGSSWQRKLGEPLPRPGPSEARRRVRGAVGSTGPRAEARGAAVRRRSRRPGEAVCRPARPLAAGPAAELASTRGQVFLVALLLPHERPDRRRASGRARADRCAQIRRARRANGPLGRIPLPRSPSRSMRSRLARKCATRPRAARRAAWWRWTRPRALST